MRRFCHNIFDRYDKEGCAFVIAKKKKKEEKENRGEREKKKGRGMGRKRKTDQAQLMTGKKDFIVQVHGKVVMRKSDQRRR